MKRLFSALLLSVIGLSGVSKLSHAGPYIQADDWRLRQDIFTLANAGVLSSTVTTFPLAWVSIEPELTSTQLDDIEEPSGLNQSVKAAYTRVLGAFHKSQQSTSELTVFAGTKSKPPRSTSETNQVSTNVELGLRGAYFNEGVWIQGELSILPSPIERYDQSTLQHGNSFVAQQLGNWLLSIGYMQHKFGPGNDTQLFRSANASSPPSFYVSRVNDQAFETPWLSWIGPWTFVHGVSVLDDDRYIKDAFLWTMRASFRPFDAIEIGLSKAAQLCGQDKSCDFSQWRRTFSGDTNVWDGENPANQVAGVDLRFSGLALGLPFELYWESIGEDAVRVTRYPPFQAKSHLYGGALDVSWGRMFVEYSDTGARCSNGLNCTYEHSAYRSGYRYKRKTFGSAYDNDTKALVLGLRTQFDDAHYLAAHARILDQNYDDSNSSFPSGNPVATEREKNKQVEVLYGFPLNIAGADAQQLNLGSLELGGQVTKSELTGSHSVHTALWMSWEKHF